MWQPQYTTGNCAFNAHSLIWHQTQGNKSNNNFHDSVLFKEAWYPSRVFHMETYNNHKFFNYLASTLLRRSKIGVYLFFFHFQEADCWLDWVWKGHLFTLIRGQRKMPICIFKTVLRNNHSLILTHRNWVLCAVSIFMNPTDRFSEIS